MTETDHRSSSSPLSTKPPRTVTAIHLDTRGTTDCSGLEEVAILHLRKDGDRQIASAVKPTEPTLILPAGIDFSAGNHACRLLVRIRKDTDLLHRVGLQITRSDFADGDPCWFRPGRTPPRLDLHTPSTSVGSTHNKDRRRGITTQMSLDDGLTWPETHHVLLDQGTGFGYSSLVMVDDHTLAILYQPSAADMTFQKIPLSDVL